MTIIEQLKANEKPFGLIVLTKDKVAVVDANDFDRINKHNWYASNADGVWRAYRRRKTEDGKGSNFISMHREVLNFPDCPYIDHIDHDGLDNRKGNLRECTAGQNMANMRSNKNTSSKYKGVHLEKRSNKWVASIQKEGVHEHLGTYSTEIEAAEVYDKRAKELFGEFANANL